MTQDMAGLTEREKETLRLLLAGHEAKSIARELDLSVHTVNDRLRNARTKLGVGSSREAARRLAEMEDAPEFSGSTAASPHVSSGSAPQEFVDRGNSHAGKEFGIADVADDRPDDGHSQTANRKGRLFQGHSLVWLAGGMIIMSLVIAVVALSSMAGTGSATADNIQSPSAPTASTPAATTESVGASAARAWLALVDAGQLDESWTEAGSIFRAQVTQERWSQMVTPVREPLGAVISRKVRAIQATGTLPGMPDGEYEVIEFDTSFEKMNATVETVTVVHEDGRWAVIGYYVRPA